MVRLVVACVELCGGQRGAHRKDDEAKAAQEEEEGCPVFGAGGLEVQLRLLLCRERRTKETG